MIRLDISPRGKLQPRVGFALLIGLIVLVAAGKPILFDTLDPDCFWHLRVAEQLRSDGIGPLIDRLSFASLQRPWTPYSWLAELAMDSIWKTGGWRAAVLVQALLQATFILFIAMACRTRPAGSIRSKIPRDLRFFFNSRGRKPTDPVGKSVGFRPRLLKKDQPQHRAEHDTLPSSVASGRKSITDDTTAGELESAIVTVAAAVLSLPYLSFRPATAALAMLAMCNWLIVRDRRSGERTLAVWMLVPATALLINVHLYAVLVPFWIGALLLGAMIERQNVKPEKLAEADRRVTRYGRLLAGTAAACLATPMLPGVVESMLRYQFDDPMVASGFISEMRPFYAGVAGKISAAIVILLCGFMLFSRRRIRAGEWLWLGLSTILLFRLGRFAPIFAIVAAPIFSGSMPRLSNRILQKPAMCGLIAVVLALGVIRLCIQFPSRRATLETWLNRHGPGTPGYPCAAADFVASNVKPVSGHLINEFTWGGYLEWRLGNNYQTLLDGRTQLFSSAFWRAIYLGTEDRRAWYLSQLQADAAILPIERSLFQQTLLKQGWHVAYHDDRAQVLFPPANVADGSKAKWPFASMMFGE